jgi:hypothetical protein
LRFRILGIFNVEYFTDSKPVLAPLDWRATERNAYGQQNRLAPMKLRQCTVVTLGLVATSFLPLRAHVLLETSPVPSPRCESGAASASAASGDAVQCDATETRAPWKSPFRMPPEQPSGFVQTLQRTHKQQQQVDEFLSRVRNLAARPLTTQSIKKAFPWVRLNAKQGREMRLFDLRLRASDAREEALVIAFFREGEIMTLALVLPSDPKRGSCVTSDDVFRVFPFQFLPRPSHHAYSVSNAIKDLPQVQQTEVMRNQQLFEEELLFSAKHTKFSKNLGFTFGISSCVGQVTISDSRDF